MSIKIIRDERSDLQEILDLQYLAYQSEAALFRSKDIPPLKQTLDNLIYYVDYVTVVMFPLYTTGLLSKLRLKSTYPKFNSIPQPVSKAVAFIVIFAVTALIRVIESIRIDHIVVWCFISSEVGRFFAF